MWWSFWRTLGQWYEIGSRVILFLIEEQNFCWLMGRWYTKDRSLLWSLRSNLSEDIKRKAFYWPIHFAFVRWNRSCKPNGSFVIIYRKSTQKQNSLQSQAYSIGWTLHKDITFITWEIIRRRSERIRPNQRVKFLSHFNKHGHSIRKIINCLLLKRYQSCL